MSGHRHEDDALTTPRMTRAGVRNQLVAVAVDDHNWHLAAAFKALCEGRFGSLLNEA